MDKSEDLAKIVKEYWYIAPNMFTWLQCYCNNDVIDTFIPRIKVIVPIKTFDELNKKDPKVEVEYNPVKMYAEG